MRKIKFENKGIMNSKRRIMILGLNLWPIQVLFGAIRERRLIELTWGALCFLMLRIKRRRDHRIEEIGFYNTVFFEDFFIVRIFNESIFCRSRSKHVYGEYGSPGARLIYSSNGITKIYNPYADDKFVYHIHEIIYFKDDLYYISTGDSNKYLDLFHITEKYCNLVKRVFKHLGGFTASAIKDEEVIFGSDFSLRPNYILYREKILFLPQHCLTEFIIKINILSNNNIEVVSKKLNSNTGHVTFFDKELFILKSNKIYIFRPFVYEVVYL